MASEILAQAIEELIAEMQHVHDRECHLRDKFDPQTQDAALAWSLGASFVTGYFLPKLALLRERSRRSPCTHSWGECVNDAAICKHCGAQWLTDGQILDVGERSRRGEEQKEQED